MRQPNSTGSIRIRLFFYFLYFCLNEPLHSVNWKAFMSRDVIVLVSSYLNLSSHLHTHTRIVLFGSESFQEWSQSE